MSDAGGQHRWSGDQVGGRSDVDRRTAPLRSAALWGIVGAVVLGTLGLLWSVAFVLGVVVLFWAGLAGIAYWVCRALLPGDDAS